MAIATKFKIKFTCGHSEIKDLSDVPSGKRHDRARYMGKTYICNKCFKQVDKENLAKHNAQLLAEAEVFEEEHELPELTGSEKQISWATKVRYELLSAALEIVEDPEELLEPARTIGWAGWWIDYKDADAEEVLELVQTGARKAQDREERVESENPF